MEVIESIQSDSIDHYEDVASMMLLLVDIQPYWQQILQL